MKAYRLKSLADSVPKQQYSASFALRMTSVLARAMGYLVIYPASIATELTFFNQR